MAEKQITIIGLGLIGGSLGLALKKAKGKEIEIIGYARKPDVAAEAMKLGAVDRTESDLAKAVSGADIVVLAAPVTAIEDILKNIAPHVSQNALVTDVGSTKVQVMNYAEECLPTAAFIGGHPMTGKETSGLGDAESGLFTDCTYCLTPSENAGEEASQSIEEMVKLVGANPLFVDAQKHDEMVAGISHLPLILSSSLVSSLAQSPLWPEMSKLAASGYRDVTRLASGNPDLHRGICSTNRKAIVEWIDKYMEALKEYRDQVSQDDEKLLRSFSEAQTIRQKWLKTDGRRFSE